MKTLFRKNLLIVGIFLVSISCTSSDPDVPGTGGQTGDDGLVTLPADKSFSLLSLSAARGLVSGSYDAGKLSGFIQDNNTDVIALQDVGYRTTESGGKDLVSEIAYKCSRNSQRRQGVFASISQTAEGEHGVAFLIRECFYGTRKLSLNGDLALLTIPYELGSGEKVIIATCQFDRESPDKRLKQAEALVAYADTVKQNVVIAASIHEKSTGNVFSILNRKFRRSCKYSADNTYPASQPTERYDYILTPLSQNWGTQFVQMKGNGTISDHKAVFIRIGLK